MKKTSSHTRRPLTKADFAWVNWTEKDIKNMTDRAISSMKEKLSVIMAIPDGKRTFENTVIAIDHAFGELMIFGSAAGFISILWVLGSTSPNPNIQTSARAAEQDMRRAMIDIEYDPRLYAALTSYAKNAQGLSLTQKKLLADWIGRFKRMGFHLPKTKQVSLNKQLREVATLGAKFQSNLDDYEDHILVTKEELEGLSDNYIATLEKAGNKYKVGLSYPEFGPFMSRAKNREKRFLLAEKNAKKGGKENLTILKKMALLRHKNAQLLGYKNHFAFKTENRMSQSEKNVHAFLEHLLTYARKTYEKELNVIIDRRNRDLGIKDKHMYGADSGYYTRILGEETFSIDSEKIREYFPLEHVITATFKLFKDVLGLTFKEVNLQKLHPDIRWYEVTNKKGIVGYLCLDLFPRPKKYSHMCAETFRTSFTESNGSYRTPGVIMVGNFTKSSKTAPSLISHGELTTFLHELGHLVHGLTSDTEYATHHSFFVQHDFVEVPSQMFENFAWNEKILTKLSKHYKTGKVMPASMIQNLLKIRFFRQASLVMGQLELAFLDYQLHAKQPKQDPSTIALNLKRKMTKITPPKGTLWPASFGHMRDYDAGYYSYLWALVLADDVWTRFKEEGAQSKKVGHDLIEKIFSKGASKDATELLKDFLVRKPNNKAFLKRFK